MFDFRIIAVALVLLGSIPGFVLSQSKKPLAFSFTLSSGGRTSAGVFTKDGTLIRTLWSAQTLAPGSYTQTWDGLDDQRHLVSPGDYEIQLLTNNITYTWEGVLGNTSSQATGPTVHHDFEPIAGMAITGNTAYYCSNYNEASSAQAKFNLDNPQAKTRLMTGIGYGQQTPYVATDGSRVYWGGVDPFSTNQAYSFVFATQITNDLPVSFAQGKAYTSAWGSKYASVIGVVNQSGSAITGMAVQKTGPYLFLARQGLNQLQVLNKTTGALVRNLSLSAPGGVVLATDNQLWLIAGNSVSSYSVADDGQLTARNIVLGGLMAPQTLGISPDGGTLVVADGGSSQQLKAYNTATGGAQWVFGQVGGYTQDARVSNDKFYFSDARGLKLTFVTFEPDGSFWVGDSGNYRCQHYSANRVFLETVMYVPHCRSMALDATNAGRVFADYLEFAVDYSHPLGVSNGSWQLVNNWGAKVEADQDTEFDRLMSPSTLTNGRTYALQYSRVGGKVEVVELVNGGTFRFTGILLDSGFKLYADGSIRRISDFKMGVASTWYKRELTGFDSANNPLWSPEGIMAVSPPSTQQDPLYRKTVTWGLNPAPLTSSNLIIAYEGGSGGSATSLWASNGYHLGAIRLGQTKWLWRTAPSTRFDYQGAYPTDGAYDLGNGVQYPGGPLLVQDRHLFWNYHGEFWKQSQTNKWHHVYDNGLLLGVFGVTGPEVIGQEAATGMAGNSVTGGLVKVDNEYYLYHCDESHHGGLHRWKVSGLASLQEQRIPLVVSLPNARGLLGQYIQGADQNSLNVLTSRIDSLVNFSWSGVPAGTGLKAGGGYSVRWQGFVETAFDEVYTFYVRSGQGVRLWVGDSLLIDGWANRSLVELSGSMRLLAGDRSPLRLELSSASGQGDVSLSWSSASQTKTLIPNRRLYPTPVADGCVNIMKLSNISLPTRGLYPTPLADVSQGVDLLAGLPNHGVLADKQYGWSRNPATEARSTEDSFWSARTGLKSYNRFSSPDLWVQFAQSSAVYTVSRDLGDINGVDRWRLWGRLNQEGTAFNTDEGPTKNGGYYIEVLDVNNKIIARISFYVYYNQPTQNYPSFIYGNGRVIAQGPYYTNLVGIVSKSQPLEIEGVGGQIRFQYGPYNSIIAPVLDAGSDWRSPKTFRLYFWGSGYNQTRVVDIESLRFSK